MLSPPSPSAALAGGSPAPGVPAIGDVLAGRYRILGVIGAGAMGTVLRAHDAVLERPVALKIIHAELAQDPVNAERMLVEARSVGSITSEHVARVLDMGRGPDGAPFLVLEYLDGIDFFTLLAERGPLMVEDAIDWVLEACEALAEAHAAHIVHRDLKPENLFLSIRTDGTACVKVLDFGISKRVGPRAAAHALTLPSELVGSPSYMAPEQLRLEAVDSRADVWAIGATLYELLSGRRAFDGDSFTEISARVVAVEPTPLSELRPGLPDGLVRAVHAALAKRPGDRLASIAQLAAALAPFGSERADESARRALSVLGEEPATGPANAVSGTRRIAEHREVRRRMQALTTPPLEKGKAGRLRQARSWIAAAWVGAAAMLAGATLAALAMTASPVAEVPSGSKVTITNPTTEAGWAAPAPAPTSPAKEAATVSAASPSSEPPPPASPPPVRRRAPPVPTPEPTADVLPGAERPAPEAPALPDTWEFGGRK